MRLDRILLLLALPTLGCPGKAERPVDAVTESLRPSAIALPTPGDPSPTETVYRVGDGVIAPRLIHRVEAAIPGNCQERRFDWGAFIVEARITENGDVADVRTIKEPRFTPPCPEFERAYRNAIEQWKYEPGRLNGKPVSVYLTVTVTMHPR